MFKQDFQHIILNSSCKFQHAFSRPKPKLLAETSLYLTWNIKEVLQSTMKAEAQAQLLQIHSEALTDAWTDMMAFGIKFSSEG